MPDWAYTLITFAVGFGLGTFCGVRSWELGFRLAQRRRRQK